MQKIATAAVFACLPLAAIADPRDVTSNYESVKVAEGVHAFIAPEPRSGVVNGNVTVIVGDDGVVIVDTGQFPTLAQRQIAEVKKLTSKPVRAIVNTHWHWDHNLANATWREAFPSAAIVSTAFTRDFIATFTPGFLEQMAGNGPRFVERLQAQLAKPELTAAQKEDLRHVLRDLEQGLPELQKAKLLAPDMTFERELAIHLGKREVRVLFPGRANTAGDAVVWVPDARVLVTGDLVVHPTPYATSAYPADWIAAMERLMAFDAAAIVPGHGPVQRDEKYLELVTRTLRSIVDQATAAVAEGLSLEEAKARIDLEPARKAFAGEDRARRKAFDDYFASSAVTNAYKQAKGEPTDESPFPRP
ncbi:MAG TPA: MBL fold metallo-hydrolase [Thermoanaerobaculia bacterium]|nr:MBL fold metallo-hydrolase [Thermoanaerobaculia bacterium]